MSMGDNLIASRAVLGVDSEATVADVKRAFRERASLLHPDLHAHRGGSGTNAASAAMQQLNAAYSVVLEHVRSTVGSPTTAAPGTSQSETTVRRWRCPSCSAVFQPPSPEFVCCPSCGQHLTEPADPKRNSRDDSSDRNESAASSDGHADSDREVIYSSRDWNRARRAWLTAVLRGYEVAFGWEGAELVVPKSDEQIADKIAALVDPSSLVRDSDASASTSAASEVIVSFSGWLPVASELLSKLLVEVRVPHSWEGNELVIPKSYERFVDSAVDVLEGTTYVQ